MDPNTAPSHNTVHESFSSLMQRSKSIAANLDSANGARNGHSHFPESERKDPRKDTARESGMDSDSAMTSAQREKRDVLSKRFRAAEAATSSGQMRVTRELPVDDAMLLSYEKALNMHGRHDSAWARKQELPVTSQVDQEVRLEPKTQARTIARSGESLKPDRQLNSRATHPGESPDSSLRSQKTQLSKASQARPAGPKSVQSKSASSGNSHASASNVRGRANNRHSTATSSPARNTQAKQWLSKAEVPPPSSKRTASPKSPSGRAATQSRSIPKRAANTGVALTRQTSPSDSAWTFKRSSAPEKSKAAHGNSVRRANLSAASRSSRVEKTSELSPPRSLTNGPSSSRSSSRASTPAQATPSAEQKSSSRIISGISEDQINKLIEQLQALRVAEAKQDAEDMQAEEARIDHRNATISVRLNGTEFNTLRLRASESGISVSAYMRSCVLEAEGLRAKVKEALSTMRAATLADTLDFDDAHDSQPDTSSTHSPWWQRLQQYAGNLWSAQPSVSLKA